MLHKLDGHFAPLIFDAVPEKRIGRPPIGAVRMTRQEYWQRDNAKRSQQRLEDIAVLDFETDPFDNVKQQEVKPFLAVLYRNDAEPIIIWEENNERFISAVISAIEALPRRYIIYAHNGGKFDFMFFVHRLRGRVSFKGRGIMSARIGEHELRDSFHILPEKLANMQKDDFDYRKLKRAVRSKYRDEIIRYCINDCKYLLLFVIAFLARFGLKISVGQAAMAELRKHYKVAYLRPNDDAFLRFWFFGGRVECVQGRGHFTTQPGKTLKLYDKNSMYPDVMARYQHPIGSKYEPRRGDPDKHTVFLDLQCRNYGALIARNEDGEITANIREGRFKTTIWEYETALKYGLIRNVHINWCIDCYERSDFADFILPFYEERQKLREAMQHITEGSTAWNDLNKDQLFKKYILNNSYGKFAQNPRKYKEHYFTDVGCKPPIETETIRGQHKPWDAMPMKAETHYVWSRPAPTQHFNNVGTAASITGAARANLLEAMQYAKRLLYCDTDSLICEELIGQELHQTRLGAWKLEKELDAVLIAGKKLYAYRVHGLADGHRDRVKIRSKGVSGLEWAQCEAILRGEIISTVSKAPMINRLGEQRYLPRDIKATAPLLHLGS